MKKISYFLVAILFAGCGREDVNPSDYADVSGIRPNEFVLKSTTHLLTLDDKKEIIQISDEEIIINKNAEFLSSVKVGSVLVNTASDPGDTIAFFRKVIGISELNNNIRLETKEAMLWEAYNRYIIDSRSSENIFIRTNYFPVTIECKPSNLGGWVGLSVGTIPDFNGTISFDSDSTYFTAQYDSLGTFPFRMEMRLTNLNFDLSGSVLFKGSVSVATPFKLVKDPIPVFVVGPTGLTLYVEPKIKLGLKVGGQIQSPELTLTSGPHNFFFSYDESNLGQPAYYEIDPMIVPMIKKTMDWTASGKGNAELQGGTDIFLGITGVPKLVKAGFNVYGYIRAFASQKGNFTDLQPRVSFDGEVGIGAKAFAEIGFLADTTKLINPGQWLGITSKIESPEITKSVIEWHIAAVETCTKYNSVTMYIDEFQSTNEILLTVDCPGCAGNGFYAWVNDIPIANGALFTYDESAVVTLPPGLEMLNTVAIQDKTSLGCYLSDNFMDPSLFNTNCTKFVDERDGNSYCSVTIGSQVWMGENLRYTGIVQGDTIGHWYLDDAVTDTLLFGRLYTFSEVMNGQEPNTSGVSTPIQGLCPQGWRVPSSQDWGELRTTLGGSDGAGKNIKLPSQAVWPDAIALPSTSLFNAVSAGEFYPWMLDLHGSESGNRYRNTRFWTSNVRSYENLASKPEIVEVDATNYLDLGILSSEFGFGSIEEIGYSCRCIKN